MTTSKSCRRQFQNLRKSLNISQRRILDVKVLDHLFDLTFQTQCNVMYKFIT